MSNSQRQAARDAADLPPRRHRYPGGDARDPAEISDPESLNDETRPSIREWVGNNRKLAVILLVTAPFSIGVVAWLLTRLAPELLSNPWVRRGGAVALWTGAVAVHQRRQMIRTVCGVAELNLKTPQGNRTYKGRFEISPDGDLLFSITKGFDWLGRPTDQMEVQELSAKIANEWEAEGGDPSDPAKVLLRPEYTAVTRADYGTRVVALSKGIEPKESGTHTILEASKPDMADQSALDSANDLIEDQEQEITDLQRRIYELQRQKNDAEQRLTERKAAIREDLKEDLTDVAEATALMRSRPSASKSSDAVGAQPIGPGGNGTLEDTYLEDDA